jgi:hypothetical protein
LAEGSQPELAEFPEFTDESEPTGQPSTSRHWHFCEATQVFLELCAVRFLEFFKPFPLNESPLSTPPRLSSSLGDVFMVPGGFWCCGGRTLRVFC